MTRLFLLFVLASTAGAQIVSSFNKADPCGGRPAWLDATHIIEDTSSTLMSGVCSVTLKPATKITNPTPLFDLMEASGSGSSWTVQNLTGGMGNSFRSDMGIDENCSIGNPDAYSDGTVYHLVAIVQDTPGTGSPCATASGYNLTPGQGGYYDVMFCNAIGTALSVNHCAILILSRFTGQNAFLDPHIDPVPDSGGRYHVYISEQNPTTPSGAAYWSIDDIPIAWNDGSSGAPTLAGSKSTNTPGTWTDTSCVQYFKATSVQHLSSGTIRIYTQADAVSYYDPAAGSCLARGHDPLSAGLFYFDLGSSTLHQIYPAVAPPSPYSHCLTPGGAVVCYGEFPLVLENGEHLFMIFVGTTLTPPDVLDACFARGISVCPSNLPSETLVMDLGNDTQNPAPGNIVVRQSDFQTPNTYLNLQLLPGGIVAGNAGNCSHLSLNVASRQLTCSFQSNLGSQTLVFSQKQTLAFPSALILNSAGTSGKVSIN